MSLLHGRALRRAAGWLAYGAWEARARLDAWRCAGRSCRIGWITANTLAPGPQEKHLGRLGSALDMRVSNVARWINATTTDVWNEIYRPGRRYDVVVFCKAMDEACQAEAASLRARGVRVIFDANVNYYEVWGEYDVPGTQPSEEQRRDAIRMTAQADYVVADSSYIAEVARKHNDRVRWIPDNVDPRLFRGTRTHAPTKHLTRLVWSGVSKKAQHLLGIVEALGSLRETELILVSERRPDCMDTLASALPVRYVAYSDAAYARLLAGCDVIISPKRLCNAYEMGHSEYKITLGMAAGLPAVASPQPSYVEAISHAGGGLLADSVEEWKAALGGLVADWRLRAELGAKAARTVRERYATPVVSAEYLALLRELL